MDFEEAVKRGNAEQLAKAYLEKKYGMDNLEIPINPFQLLVDEDVSFTLLDLSNLEGIYIPKAEDGDLAVVGINVNRLITRQRFTAAHELCHHLKDSDKTISCPIGGEKNRIEKFADAFAAAVLMPYDEFKHQVNIYIEDNGYISFDAVLEIANYFGVSFEACLFRAAYTFHVIEGETDSSYLKLRAREYEPDNVRKHKGYTYANLYSGLLDCCSEQLALKPENHALYKFQSNYIYNDSRMEGLDIEVEQASEIVADLRLNMRNSQYCTEDNEAFLSIAGHYSVYQSIFDDLRKPSPSVFDMIGLHKKLYEHYPFPEFGGQFRDSNTLVLGAKFETTDYGNIIPRLTEIDKDVQELFENKSNLSLSEYLWKVVEIHHALTVVHPFRDGNGRISRAFMNSLLFDAGMIPVYIRLEDKHEYEEALAKADQTGKIDSLFEVIAKSMLRI